MTTYQEHIASLAPDWNARHVEAWLRLEHGTLDHLSLDAKSLAPFLGMAAGHPEESEELAESFGL